MLRACLPVSRQLAQRPIIATTVPQWQRMRPPQYNFQRTFAESKSTETSTKASIKDSDSIVLPGTLSNSASQAQPPPPGSVSPASPAAPSSNTSIPPENVPRMPPTPAGGKIQTAPPSSIPAGPASSPQKPLHPPNATTTSNAPPPSTPPPPRRKSGRFRRFALYLILLSGFSYAGGVYYSLVSDNFHDFFTEYVPFGEEAVLFFEEREYRKRFPSLTNPTNRPVVDSGNKVTIPSKSGVSWRVAGEEKKESDLITKGNHTSTPDAKKTEGRPGEAEKPGTGAAKTKAVERAKQEAPAPKPAGTKPKDLPPPRAAEKPAATSKKESAEKEKKAENASLRPPEVDEPSRVMPIEPIAPLKIQNADEPVVQDIVRIVNDLITVINNDNSSHKYYSTIGKAKAALAGAGRQIIGLKQSAQQAAADEIRSMQTRFDTGARELVRRLEDEMRLQEGRWRDDFDSERDKLANSYNERLSTEMKRAQEVMDQRIRNELLEQAITLKKQFLEEVTNRVETERDGRLSKLSDLSSSVSELEQLTADWNAVVDANLKTQHLQVAVEAVRSSLENTDRPRPFVRELAALKEIAAEDPLVNAAIASINPSAYQRGVPTTPQLIDRFRRVAAEVRKAGLLPEDAGVASHAASFMLSKFLFRKQGMTVGDDVESVLTRTETLLEEGRLDEAVREANMLEGWAKTLSWDWLSECRRVLEVRQAMDVIAVEARLEGLKAEK